SGTAWKRSSTRPSSADGRRARRPSGRKSRRGQKRHTPRDLPDGSRMASVDVVIIGAGHNGLVAANYLARAGLRVIVIERSDRVGGACVTDEIAPGFRVSAAAYVTGLFRPKIIEDLELKKFGLRQVPFHPQAFCPFSDGRALRLWYDGEETAAEIAKFSKKDAKAYPAYEAM